MRFAFPPYTICAPDGRNGGRRVPFNFRCRNLRRTVVMTASDAGLPVRERGRGTPAASEPRAAGIRGDSGRLVVVSNRVGPIAAGKLSQGGLAVALRAALERAGGIWFGYSGSVAERPSETPKFETEGNITAATLDLSRRDFEEYYIGYANRVLWPLFHYRPSLVGFSRKDLAGYLRVNRIFARALFPLLMPGDLEGLHDYLLRWAGGEELGDGVFRAFGRVVRLGVFPVGIDVETIAAQALAAETSRHTRRLRDSIGERALLLGVDRLDYSKGLPERFEAYSHLLEHYPQIRGRTEFLQIAPPSRSDVPEYRQIRRALETASGSINGRYAEFDWTPLRYLNKSFNHRILTGFYRAARLALVTPLRDGMNLVVKEYLASQAPEDPGMPVLSCFAGAAHELGEAIIVNPNDREGVAEAILQGLEMPLGERLERWNAMMKTLRRNDADSWRRRFIETLAAVRHV